MGKREAAHDPDPESDWGDFIARRRQQIEDRKEPPYIPPKPLSTSRLEDIPPDVPYDDKTLTCWNGTAFVSWYKWRLSVPFRKTDDPPKEGS